MRNRFCVLLKKFLTLKNFEKHIIEKTCANNTASSIFNKNLSMLSKIFKFPLMVNMHTMFYYLEYCWGALKIFVN